MRLPKRGERGFTLIELLIVVAILGVLAAVVIPNVGRFIGRGEEEAKDTELANIQAAVSAMMIDNNLATIHNPVQTSTNEMGAFPDSTTAAGSANKTRDREGFLYGANDKDGYLLYTHDVYASNSVNITVNYVAANTTSYYYTVDAYGTVEQHLTSGEPHP